MPPPTTLQSSTTGMSAGSESSKVDLADQKEIEAIWKEVNAKVLELAGGDPKKVKNSLTIDDVLKYIDSVQKTDAAKSEEYGTFKTIVTTTLQCIGTVGGIVTDGVSNVFAPAGMCYNAFTFVIQAWQGYEGTFTNLAELLDKCVEFFERLQSYQGRMDGRLTRLASQNLRLFVAICERMIKLRKKHNRLFRFTQQLFLNDDGVQDLLGMMDKLNSKEALLVNAQTYRIVSDSAGDIKLLLEAQRDAKRSDEAKRWRRSIAKALGFPGTALDSDEEPVLTWQRAFETRLNSLVDGTGTWWKTDDTFSHWATAQYPEESVLVLSGAGGTGKTSMMANTIKSIRRLGSEAPSSRVVVAYYFADGDKRKPDDDDDDSGFLDRVSRTLLWQLATSYEAMTKSVAWTVERATHFDGALDRWNQLFFKNKELQNSNTTFYLFIDTQDPDLDKLLQEYYKSADQTKVRVFLTARPDSIVECLSKKDGPAFAEVRITSCSSGDVEKYIVSRMDAMPTLQDTSRQDIPEWRQVIVDQLRDQCGGDYYRLNNSLGAISKVHLIEDLIEVLKEAGKPRVTQIKAEIRQLNKDRTIKEVREINEIIVWIEQGREYFGVDMLEALLSVKHQKPSFTLRSEHKLPPLLRRHHSSTLTLSASLGDTEQSTTRTAISLLPLSQKLRDKYPIFSITDSGKVDWRNSEIKNHVPTLEDSQDIDAENEAELAPQIIQESEITIVKHFLTKVCPKELYQRFEFDGFFSQKMGASSKEFIHIDSENGHIKIVHTCLLILTDVELRSQTVLRRYAAYWLLEHMEAVNLSEADRKLKGLVGPLLVRLFTEDCGIDSLFWCFDVNVSSKTWKQGEAINTREARWEWVYSKAGVRQIERWFNDSTVTKTVTSPVGIAFIAAVKTPQEGLHQAVLSFAAKRMATHLFLKVEFLKRHFLTATCFLRGYLARLEGTQMPDDPQAYRSMEGEDYERWESSTFSSEALQKIETWATEALGNPKSTPALESQWEIHGALQAFQLYDNDEEMKTVSQKRARRALELNPQNWHACHFVAGRPSTSKEEGAELLKRAKGAIDEIRANDKEWVYSSANTALLARITFDLGNQLWDLGEFASAARTHRESLDYDYVHFNSYAKILGKYQDRGQWNESIAFIETLNSKSGIWKAYFDELINEFIMPILDEDSDMLAQAADATNNWDAIKTFFTIATEVGGGHQAYELLFSLREAFARTLELTDGAVDEKMVVSIRVAALESIKAHPSDTLSQHSVNQVTDSLAQIYLNQAFEPPASEEKTESLGSLLTGLLPDVEDGMETRGKIVTICCIIRYDFKRQKTSAAAKRWIERIVRASIELLSDSDDDNDAYAYYLLGQLFAAIEDEENRVVTWNMRNALQTRDIAKWEQWVSTPIASPTKTHVLRQDSIDNRLSRASSDMSMLTISRQDSTPTSGAGQGNAQAPGGDGVNANGSEKPARTPTSSSAPEPTLNNDEFKRRGPPRRIETDIVEAEDAPLKPTKLVYCDGCDNHWTVIDEPLMDCADCVSNVQFCQRCHALLMNGELKRKGLKCKREHKFAVIPAWDAERFKDLPKSCLPLPADNPKRWVPLEEWKETLKRLYLPEKTSSASV
ncbi:hypothetical protein F4808DRAFT_417300 [Astrocystis sublimbata]|nr:hypothetical protein F4808DRAFT_417300 [Astrocystis sublimbata]